MKLVLYFLLSFNLFCFSVQSQIITNSGITVSGTEYQIKAEYGKQTGSILTHDFTQFDINTGESAVFQADSSVSNIIASVSKSSWIDGGLISPVSLLLKSPEGISFGPNAFLDINGSFNITTKKAILDENKNPKVIGGDINFESSNLLTYGNDLFVTGGNINIKNSVFETNGTDKAGNVSISGYDVKLDNSEIYARSFGGSEKSSVSIKGSNISLINGCYIAADTCNDAAGVDIKINSTGDIEFSGIHNNSYITEISATSFDNADSGNIFVRADGNITFDNGAWLSSQSYGSGKGGDISVIAKNLFLLGESPDFYGSGIYANVPENASGNGGNITVNTENITAQNGAYIDSCTHGTGNAGNIVIKNTDTINMTGATSTGWATGIYASTDPEGNALSGNGGNINIETSNLFLDNGAQISASSIKGGLAGSIDISADTIFASGQNPYGENEDGLYSGIYARSLEGLSDAGKINISADNIILTNGGIINTEATHAGGGQIKATADNRIYLSDGGTIQTSVGNGEGNGGDIEVGSRFVILNSGNIEANADAGDGGAIFIKTEHYIKSADSTVSASSRRGNDGTITIISPDTDVSKGLATLPGNMLDLSAWTKNTCSPAGKASRFIIQGKDNADVRIKGIQ